MAVTRTVKRHSGSRGELVDLQILLIEDQRSLAQMAAKMLYERWGCSVLIATSLAQVRAIIAEEKHQFFVAVSDLALPDAPDGEVIEVLIAAGIRVIAITGTFNDALHDKMLNLGVVDYVLKNSINAYEYVVELVGRLFRNLQTRVLVVDDSRTFCALIEKMLRIQGLQVSTAANGAAALEVLAQQTDIQLVLLDHEMPVMDGYQFLSSLRRKIPKDKLAVIGMSGTGNSRVSAEFLKLGANDYISKPFSYEELNCRVTQNLEMQESLTSVRYIAYHDYLTGLLNRRAFFEQGAELFSRCKQAGRPLAVAVMDIDFFKKVNDSYGHDGGDVVLKDFAALLNTHFKTDLVGRVGGEEFFLLFEEAELAAAKCEAYRKHVEAASVYFGKLRIAYTISIGITRQIPDTLDEMLRLADAALYLAKTTGRNRVVTG